VPLGGHVILCVPLHGGADGSGAPKGGANGRYSHGQFTCEAMETRALIREMMKEMRAFAAAL
jgi:hypothetical protein